MENEKSGKREIHAEFKGKDYLGDIGNEMDVEIG
jgi:hypothetical protein